MVMKKWIQGMDMKKGAFTKMAKSHHQTVMEYANTVLKKGSEASPLAKKRANLAKTLSRIRRG